VAVWSGSLYPEPANLCIGLAGCLLPARCEKYAFFAGARERSSQRTIICACIPAKRSLRSGPKRTKNGAVNSEGARNFRAAVQRKEMGHRQVSGATLARMAKRGYSHDFPIQTSRRVKIEIDRVPPALAVSLRAKAKRQGISIRALTLTLWKDWIEKS